MGYCGLVVPSRQLFQGFWLARSLEPPASSVVRRAREQCRDALRHPAAGGPPGEVVRSVAHLPDAADQHAVGLLAAGFATVALRGDEAGAGVMASALRLLLGWDNLWVEAEVVEGQGVRTRTVELLEGAATPEEGRRAFGLLPQVVGLRGVAAGERLPDTPVVPSPRRGR